MSDIGEAVNKKRLRVLIGALVVSAAGAGTVALNEGFTDHAVIPVKGDRPTYGYGSTWRPDGTPVQMGDTITRKEAAALLQRQLGIWEAGVKRCVKAPLHQEEYDVLVDFAHQYGVAAACNSGIVRNVNAGNYRAACMVYVAYSKIPAGRNPDGSVKLYDCSTPGNRICPGVYTRNLERQKRCLSVQD